MGQLRAWAWALPHPAFGYDEKSSTHLNHLHPHSPSPLIRKPHPHPCLANATAPRPPPHGLRRSLTKFSPPYDGDRFFTQLADGTRVATPLLLVLAVVELSDVVFAVDSIPAVSRLLLAVGYLPTGVPGMV